MVAIGRWSGLLLVLLLTVSFVAAADHIIVNSQDWRDVYTGSQYGYLTGTPSNFLVSTRHSTILLYAISTDKDEILVLSSRSQPFITGYESILLSRGYDSPEEVRESNLNLYLLEQLEDVDRFIVLDDAYGYNAISVAPFAIQDKSFVIFATEDNIDDIVSILDDKNPEKILIYGQVDRAVKDELAQFNPETLNLGNRFDNNIEIVKRYQDIKPTRQVILTNGEFIEAGIMSGADPVLFLGRENVPEAVRSFIIDGGIDVGILIGNELVNAATFVRRQLGISVFVKFAQGARQPTGSISQVEDLDRFPMPSYQLGIEIASIVYNRATGSLEVTYHNTQDLAIYFRSTITITDGDNIIIIGDDSPIFLDKNEYKTIVYQVDSDGNPLVFQNDELRGDAFVVFGEGPKSLENTYQKSFDIDLIDILDDAEIEIIGLYYDKLENRFYVEIENVGTTDAYVSVELIELIINGEPITIGGDGVIKIAPGKKAKIPVDVDMDEEDLDDNPEITVRAYYGERELSRIKIKEETFPLEFRTGYTRYVIYGLILVLVLWLLLLLATKKKCKHCGYKNARGRKKCVRCGRLFKEPKTHRNLPHR
ncbi:hypothetical protein GOV11_03080 [Candidatus Woesearchaeota archaeon]|nr:hypothetical protein [Candidatus Woesearchaeota archaeon]